MEGGGFQCRVILPDDKKSEADVILWYRREPTRTSMEAQHRASVMALHHVMGNRRWVIFQPENLLHFVMVISISKLVAGTFAWFVQIFPWTKCGYEVDVGCLNYSSAAQENSCFIEF